MCIRDRHQVANTQRSITHARLHAGRGARAKVAQARVCLLYTSTCREWFDRRHTGCHLASASCPLRTHFLQFLLPAGLCPYQHVYRRAVRWQDRAWRHSVHAVPFGARNWFLRRPWRRLRCDYQMCIRDSRQIASFGGEVDTFVPPCVAAALKERFCGLPAAI